MPTFTFIETPLGTCLEGAGPQKLAALLAELDELLATMGVNLDTVLQPGISADEVRDTLATVDLVPPDELLVWYGWHNGLREENNEHAGLTPFVLPAELAWSIADYRYQLHETVPLGLWSKNWLSLESDSGALAVFCSGNSSDLPLLRRQHEETYEFVENSTAHQTVSLSTMVALWIQALEDGIVWPTFDDGHLDWGADGPRIVALDAGRFILI